MNRRDNRGTGLSRRTLLSSAVGYAGLASTGVSVGALTASSAQAAPALDTDDPAAVLRMLTRMRGGGDEQLAFGWLKARRFGVLDAELTPLMGLVTGTFTRYRFNDNSSVTSTSFELAFYTDLASGELLETATMPYTGKTVGVPHIMLGPSRRTTHPLFHDVTVTRDQSEDTESENLMRPKGYSRVEQWLGPVDISENHVAITESSSAVRVPADPTARNVVYSESVTWRARKEDISQQDDAAIPAAVSFTAVSSWRPWMQMGDHPGHTTAHGIGGWAFDKDSLPEDFRQLADRYYPDAFSDPGAVLDSLK